MVLVMIDSSFLSYAASVLADTNEGLSGSEICKLCNKYAVDYDLNFPKTLLTTAVMLGLTACSLGGKR